MVVPGHDGALLCWLSPACCVLLCLLLLTLQLFFYSLLLSLSAWCNPVLGTASFHYFALPSLLRQSRVITTVSFHYFDLPSLL